MPTNTTVTKALSQIQSDPSKILRLNIGNHINVKPGQYIPRADAQPPPEPFLPPNLNPPPGTTYILITLDIDAPFPSLPVLSPILHWIQPGLQHTPTPSSSTTDHNHPRKLTPTAPSIGNYIGPAPPPGSAPHRYVFLLYEEPEGFEGGKYAGRGVGSMSMRRRVRWDFERWAGGVGLDLELGGFVGGCWVLCN
ncbi:hypothetical protein FQN50_003018 [Emmonsiellopsis sp. PD_5]|nr:hypothetical protein FQN50_003018 [Emmonsiellopsis sp. PD_5]